jgi:ADP-heptose:LPS heptosyltransferase
MSENTLAGARKICIVKADRIGDIVLLSGYLKFLADALPDAVIDLHVAPDMIGLAKLLHPRINTSALPFGRHLDVEDNELAAWLWDLDHRDYDHLLIPRFTLGEPDVLALRYLSIEHRHGFPNFENPIPEDWLTLRLGPAKREMAEALAGPTVDAWSHEVEKYAALARWQGFDVDVAALEPALYLDGEAVQPNSRRAGLLIWPGASEAHKRWPVARFQTLIETIDTRGESLTIGGTPDEEPIVDDLCDLLADQTPRKWICNREELVRTAERLARYRAVLANDTGIAHVAAAVGCRVISLSSAVHEGRFTLRGNRSTTVFADVPCRRCNGDCIFDEPVWPCITEIQPEDVASHIDLSKRPPTTLTVSAPTFEKDAKRLLASVSSRHARTTIDRKRQQAQLHFSRMIADDLRRRAEAQAEELRTEHEEAQTRMVALKSEAAAAADLQRQAQERISDLEAETQALDRLRAEIAGVREAAALEREQHQALRLQLEETKAEKQAALKREQDLLAQLDRLSEAVTRMSDHADRVSAERAALSATRQKHLQRIETLREQLQQTGDKLGDVQQQLQDREEQAQELAEQLSLSETTREELTGQLSELAEDKQQLVSEYDALVADSSQLSARINELETSLKQAEDNIHERLNQAAHLRRQRETSVRRLLLLRQQLRESQSWANSLVHAGFKPTPTRHSWQGPPAPAPTHPRISIVTPSYNTAPYIEETITSILAQDYPDFEHIVLDAASGDGTIDICARYPHLKWVIEKDRGQAHAINRGLMMSTGDIVAYLNSDDIYRPGAFQAVADYFREHPDCMVLVGDCDLIDEQGASVGHWKAKAGRWVDRVRYWGWEKTHCIPQQGLFFRRELLTRVGLFDADLHMVMDLDLWLRSTREHELGVINRTLAGFRLVEGTKTISRTHEMYVEQLNICRRHAKFLPLGQRWATGIGVRRHFAGMMLKMSEHYIFNDEQRRLPFDLLMHGVREWPVLLLNPRTYLTMGQCLTRRSKLWPAIAQPHRAYLGVLWRLRNLGKNSA